MSESPIQIDQKEIPRPTFQPITARTLMADGTEVLYLAYRLTSGELDLATLHLEGTDVAPEERVIRYIRSDDAIIRVDPDGTYQKLTIYNKYDSSREPRFYLYSGRARIGSPLIVLYSGAPHREVKYGIITYNAVISTQLTKKPVTEVLIRTSRLVEPLSNLPVTNTPIDYVQPQRSAPPLSPLK